MAPGAAVVGSLRGLPAAVVSVLLMLGCQPRSFPIGAADAAAPDVVLVPDQSSLTLKS